MRNIMSRREYRPDAPHARLEEIWYVDVDHTYNVTRKPRVFKGEYAAVRTVTGEGRLTLYSGDFFTLKANSLGIFRNRDIAHYMTQKDAWQFYWFEFNIAELPAEMMNRAIRIHMSVQECAELERSFITLNGGMLYECMVAESLFNYLLAGWQLHAMTSEKKEMASQKIIALLEKGRRERLSIAALAREAGMCERSFRGAVHEATGLSPKAYMLKGEMAAAMELLRTTGMTVSEISSCFNYASPFYFSRVFKKYYGVSPQHVRSGIEL